MAAIPSIAPPVVETKEEWPRLRWTEDLCDNVLFTHAKRPPEHAPQHGGDGSHGREEGFYEFRTTRPVRAMALADPGPNGEVCRYHYTKRIKRPDGFYEVVFCSQPMEGNFAERKNSTTYIYRRKALQPGEVEYNPEIEIGFNARVGSYHTPWWTEAIYSSFAWVCGKGIV